MRYVLHLVNSMFHLLCVKFCALEDPFFKKKNLNLCLYFSLFDHSFILGFSKNLYSGICYLINILEDVNL